MNPKRTVWHFASTVLLFSQKFDFNLERMMRLKVLKVVPLIFLLVVMTLMVILIPVKSVILFIEQRTETPMKYYVMLDDDRAFNIRYVHSIHLTNVFETYEVTADEKIRMVSMTYENIGIGLPGSAGVGETFSIIDGLYTLSYDNHVIDSFTMFIATIDTDLAFQYQGNELNLKEKLEKGKSYEVRVVKQSLYQLMRGVNLYGK